MTSRADFHDAEIHCRQAEEADTVALGVLVLEALPDSPSADVEVLEFPSDPQVLGEDLLMGAMETQGALLMVAEVDGGLAALARTTPRDLVHARHVADVQILVHPEARGEGLATRLLEAIGREARQGGLRKLALRITDEDRALMGAAARAGWSLERREQFALRRGERLHHVEVWARHLTDDAAHAS